eukprot:4808170-Alexandrium_andersonii.AAC.1
MALDQGSFDLEGILGKYWQAAMGSDEELRNKYNDLGNNYAAQRSFRMDWACATYDRIQALQKARG